VRSIELGYDNKLYVGGQSELGYFTPTENGQLKYNSLLPSIPEAERRFTDVWDIVSFQKTIYFRTANRIFAINNGKTTVYKAPKEWSYLGLCHQLLYAHDYEKGLMMLKDNSWQAIESQNSLANNDPVTGMIDIGQDSIVVTTLKNGLYHLLKSNKLAKWDIPVLRNERVYSVAQTDEKHFALATNTNGVFVFNKNGQLIQQFTKTEGLQNNNILSVFLDQQQNLWLGLDNGIDMVAVNSAIKQLRPKQMDASGYAILQHQNRLYAGTSAGLFSVPLQPLSDLSYIKENFNLVENTGGQVWGLVTINGQLMLGHHEGAFTIAGNIASPISAIGGYWNFLAATSVIPTPLVLAGHYQGLQLFNTVNTSFTPGTFIDGFNESSRYLAVDATGSIWVSHPYRGLYRLTQNTAGKFTIKNYGEKEGLPSLLNNHIAIIKNKVYAATINGVYVYNEKQNRFEPDDFFKGLLGTQSIRYSKEDAEGNIWFVHEKEIGVIDLSTQKPTVIYIPELNGKILSGFEMIYDIDSRNIFIGGDKGFYHINYEKYKQNISHLHVYIRSVKISQLRDSLLFDGYADEVNALPTAIQPSTSVFGSSWKTIRFSYSSPLYANQSSLLYAYRLKGFENEWSAWQTRSEKEYTNLSAGKYTFEVKVRRNLGNESAVASYSFEVLAPWYSSWQAKLIYALLIGVLVYWGYKFQHKRHERIMLQQQMQHEEEQKTIQYQHELEKTKAETEIITLKNEKLEADLNFKNAELAASAMHLVKKGELLGRIKPALTHIAKTLDSNQTAELKKLLRALDEDDNLDKEWDSFSRHFDKVHSDFLSALKLKHPNISASELKLSAYLRMNLSSKEIAQLMNISVRGVEISRYRLRKKLELPKETGLFDYLSSI
jgi:DNA-binding CsgD family transcriptional regulator